MKVTLYKPFVSLGGTVIQFADFVSDVVDLVENPHYSTYDSDSVRWHLDDCGCIGPWEMIDGQVTTRNIQTVTVTLKNPEDVVKLKMISKNVTQEDRMYIDQFGYR